MPLDSLYSAISAEPIAAASLGQVYKAQLKCSGQVVAIKVQRPGIEEAIGLDFYLLRARLLTYSLLYLLTVPAYYALILRSLTVLEGLALYADPNFKVLAASYPYFAKRLLTDPNPYLRDALIDLLFKDGRFRQETELIQFGTIYYHWSLNLLGIGT
ncbi:hypothetical protein BHM03_00044091 [Ensete ventricosum]|nr:hypothetical protein BHM03_00044091 [Ensete ventricosum]